MHSLRPELQRGKAERAVTTLAAVQLLLQQRARIQKQSREQQMLVVAQAHEALALEAQAHEAQAHEAQAHEAQARLVQPVLRT